MTKTKKKLLVSLLDELLEEEQQQFARDTGIDPNSEDYARMARRYLGRDLPPLGAAQQSVSEEHGNKRARDAEDVAAQFEQDCRALRLKLQRG